jgi:hypothetical protein
VARDIVASTQSQPDSPNNASYESEGTVTITSRRANTLFQILHVSGDSTRRSQNQLSSSNHRWSPFRVILPEHRRLALSFAGKQNCEAAGP